MIWLYIFGYFFIGATLCMIADELGLFGSDDGGLIFITFVAWPILFLCIVALSAICFALFPAAYLGRKIAKVLK